MIRNGKVLLVISLCLLPAGASVAGQDDPEPTIQGKALGEWLDQTTKKLEVRRK